MIKDAARLNHIKDSIQKILRYTSEGKEKFFRDELIQDGVLRNLEIIGEAVKNISSEFKNQHLEISWKDITDFRNFVSHVYFAVNIKRVWNIVENKLINLQNVIETALQELENEPQDSGDEAPPLTMTPTATKSAKSAKTSEKAAAKPAAKTSSSLPQIPKTDHKPAPYKGPSREEVLALRKQYLTPALLTYYQEPLMIVEGKMQYLWDEKGRQYLDGFAGIVTVSVGHCHPKVTAAVMEQVSKLQHTTTIYLHPNVALFGKKLAEHMPAGSGLESTYFVNSGSDANDLAVTMARLYTGNYTVIAHRNGYHGGSPSAMGLTAHGTWKYPMPQGYGVIHHKAPNLYHCPAGMTPEEYGAQCAKDLEDKILYETPGKIAAFIAEPIQGVGGTVVYPKNYLKLVYEIVRKYGGLCIADEVQTGFGRTGEHFWGFENYDVTPDMVTMAKGIANGAPVGAVTTRKEIAQTLAQRIHFNTFGGNPVSMAQGLATLEVIDEENIQANAKKIGAQLMDGLKGLQEKHALIGDVRGMGLMLGVELVTDRKTKAPAKAECARVVEACKEMGLLIGKGGLNGNILRIKPPMCLNSADADFMIEVLDRALAQAAGK
jgi:alanine-glyoxylate transaminase/(R)-3-amino-2-methylpropionate-pyruvate transaminase